MDSSNQLQTHLQSLPGQGGEKNLPLTAYQEPQGGGGGRIQKVMSASTDPPLEQAGQCSYLHVQLLRHAIKS